MSHRIEERDGFHVIRMSGDISAAESREYFRAVEELLHRGPAFILLAYEQGCRYLSGPRETLQLHLAVAEFIGTSEGGAIGFVCPSEEIFGICRQLQILASGSGIHMAVFRDGSQAGEWLANERRESISNGAWRF